MSAESITISRGGQTEDLHESCGSPRCSVAILEALGVNVSGRRPADIDSEDVGGATRISVLPAGETDYDVWCAACGEFLHHGLSCECPNSADREPASGPSISLRDAPSIRALRS